MVKVCPKLGEMMNFEGFFFFFLNRQILILKYVLCPGEPRKSRMGKLRIPFPFLLLISFRVNFEFALCDPAKFLGMNLLFKLDNYCPGRFGALSPSQDLRKVPLWWLAWLPSLTKGWGDQRTVRVIYGAEGKLGCDLTRVMLAPRFYLRSLKKRGTACLSLLFSSEKKRRRHSAQI